MPKISVLIPVYNVEKYLRECLESLVNQTFKDIEFICINDGSTDSSLKILEEYAQKDSRIKIINKENSGYGASMNMGLDAASGEYIGIVESDDFVSSNMFEDLYNLAEKNNADIVKSDYYTYLTSKNQYKKAGRIIKFKCNKVINSKMQPKLLRMQAFIWSAIYKSEFLKKNNIRFLETKGASYQDTSFAFKTMALAERVYLTPKAYLNYRIDNENSSINSGEKVFAICEEYREITDFLNKNPEIKKYANPVKLHKQYNDYMWNLTRIDSEYIDIFVEKFANEFKVFYDAGELDGVNKINPKLIENRNAFREDVENYIQSVKFKKERRKQFSVHINASRVSIVLFGKQIVGIG